MEVSDAYKIVEEAKKKLFIEINNGTHEQFIYNPDKERYECRCGYQAIWWKTGFLCGTITAYPCKYPLKNETV